MKKYLMSGVAAIAFLAAFTSCSKSTDLYEEGRKEKDQQEIKAKSDAEKLTNSFENIIGGDICSTNDWGFGSAAMTRALTRGVNTNGNEWGLYVEVPQPLTEAQKKTVSDWFKANRNPEGIALNWSDFFVQQVYKGEWGSNMNYLYCGSETDHTNNFNAGDGGTYGNVCYGLQPGATDQNQRIYGSDKIEFMVNSSTEYFGFHNSFDSNFYIDNYVIIPGDKIDSSVAGMYFVGFDFEADGQSDNQKVARDYIFDNWIVKITPGLYRDNKTHRIMCEDLYASDLNNIKDSDWDFNDVVFDARTDGNQTIIILYAAGGTLPLTIGGVEVHDAFKVETGIMVNTENGTVDKPVAIFRLNQVFRNANEIPVTADGRTLTAVQGEVPMKLCVPTGTKWLKEKVIITDGYPDFANYAHLGSPTNWYETQVNNGSLVSK